MKNEYYYVYCQGILGVKTNISDFKWVYGSVAPSVSFDEYEKCIVKFEVYVKPEKELGDSNVCGQRFHSFLWDDGNRTLFYRRTLMSNLQIGYDISFVGNTVKAFIGKRYYKFIKNRTMNLHGTYYLLSDIANMMLLNNGFLTLYASAICYDKRGVVCFAPPNTGKTITATKLCELSNCRLLGEDIIITDGQRLFACPWTSTYRKKAASFDSAGSFGRVSQSGNINMCDMCDLTDLIVLSLGKKTISNDKDELLRQICILNGYLFNYYSSPIVKVLGYFNKEYSKPWNELAETLLRDMTNNSNCCGIQSEKALDFWDIIHYTVLGHTL